MVRTTDRFAHEEPATAKPILLSETGSFVAKIASKSGKTVGFITKDLELKPFHVLVSEVRDGKWPGLEMYKKGNKDSIRTVSDHTDLEDLEGLQSLTLEFPW